MEGVKDIVKFENMMCGYFGLRSVDDLYKLREIVEKMHWLFPYEQAKANEVARIIQVGELEALVKKLAATVALLRKH